MAKEEFIRKMVKSRFQIVEIFSIILFLKYTFIRVIYTYTYNGTEKGRCPIIPPCLVMLPAQEQLIMNSTQGLLGIENRSNMIAFHLTLPISYLTTGLHRTF